MARGDTRASGWRGGVICFVCAHERRTEIEILIREHVDTYVEIGRLFGLGANTVQRHASLHMGEVVGVGGRVQCVVCAHPDRVAIDQAILRGQPRPAIADEWALSRDSIQAHAVGHLGTRGTVLPGVQCSVCQSQRRDEIEADWTKGHTAASIARVYGVPGRSAVERHMVPDHLARAAAAAIARLETVRRYIDDAP